MDINKKVLFIFCLFQLNYSFISISQENHLYDILHISHPYKILGLSDNATKDEARMAYRQLKKECKKLGDSETRTSLEQRIRQAYKQIAAYLECRKMCKRIFRFSYLPKCIITDLIHSLSEFYRIKALGSQDYVTIKRISFLGKIINLSSIIFLPIRFINQLAQGDLEDEEPGNIVNCARIANLFPSFAAVKFFKYDRFIYKNAKRVARDNKEINRNFYQQKRNQTLWMILNKILPYLGFIYSRRKNDNALISKIFDLREIAQSNGKSNNVLMVFRALANISEIMRKQKLYRLVLGELKSLHQENKEKTLKQIV